MASDTPESAGTGLGANKEEVVPRISLGEVGFTGLRTTNGMIIEEANRVFRYPMFFKTVNEMLTDPTVSAALNVYRMMISRVKWSVRPPENPTKTDIERAKFAESCMNDMEDSWSQFISEVITYLPYGFSVQEKVYRRRLKRNGSKYNDGLVGLRKLAPRSQDTIRHWNFSEDGRELESIGQSLINLENGARYSGIANSKNGLIEIKREKFLLFSADSIKGNPEGKSILKAIYLPYKQLTMLKDQLMLGIAKDLSAIPMLGLPPQMMDANASPEHKAAYESYKRTIDNIAAGTQRGIIVPLMYDPETKQPVFKFELLEARGQNKFDLPSIVKQLQNDILVALSADVITFGSDVQGSFSIKDSKTNLLAIAIEHRLNEIRDVLNNDLLKQLYALNGWSQERMPTFEFGDIVDLDSEALSKALQRTASVGLVEIDRAVLNRVRELIGVDPLPSDGDVDHDILTGASSRSGDGMAPGTTGNGTAKMGGDHNTADASANNLDNAA